MSKQQYSDTVLALFDKFIRECKVYQKSDATIANYVNSFRIFVDAMQIKPNDRICKIDRCFVTAYAEKLANKGLSVASVNHYLRDTRAFIYWCIEQEYLSSFKIKTLKDTTPMKQPYRKEEISILLRKPRPEDPFVEWRSWAVVNTIMGCGARSMSIVNMIKDDINFQTNSIYLRHSKDGRSNMLPMVPSLKKALMAYLRNNPHDTDFLFPNIHGGKMTPNGLRHSIEDYNKGRGVKQTSVHLLRHTFGALWAENGGDVYQLQRIMTHKDIRTTQNYINMYQDKTSDARAIKFNPLENM